MKSRGVQPDTQVRSEQCPPFKMNMATSLCFSLVILLWIVMHLTWPKDAKSSKPIRTRATDGPWPFCA